MRSCHTKQFGPIEYDEPAVVHFPRGLPAFEDQTRFLLIEQEETAPVVFLQSLVKTELVFLTLPARLVDPEFRLQLQEEDCEILGLDPAAEPRHGDGVIALSILTVRDGVVTANLLAPVVIGARMRHGLQVIQTDSGYRVDQPLAGAVPCS